MEAHTNEERARTGTAPPDGERDGEAVATAGTVASAGRRMITEDWAATIVGLVLLLLILAGVIGKGLVP